MCSVWIFVRRVLGALVVLCSLMFVGCGPSTPPAITLPAGQWESISLPIAGYQLLSYTTSPIDPATVFACTNDSHGNGFIDLWRTRDAGRYWSLLSLPGTTGSNCSISIAPSRPQRIAFLVSTNEIDARPCDRDTLYLSSDGGDSWRPVPHASIAPQEASNGYCMIEVTSHHVYFWYTYGGGMGSTQVSLLERTDNDGINWSRADSDFGTGSMFFLPRVGDDETLAIIAGHALSAAGPGPMLWMSYDAGHSWQHRGAIPSPAGIFLLTSHQRVASWPTSGEPFYDLVEEQIPSNLYQLKMFESTDGRQWFAVPPMPVPGASAKRPGLLQALAVTGDGRLVAFGVNPKTGVPVQGSVEQRLMAAFWLWMWDPRASRWQVLSSPLTYSTDEGCGLCWSGQLASGLDHVTYLYVYHWGDSSLFRVRLPDLR